MMAVNRAVEALADDPAPLGAFVRGARDRLALLLGHVCASPSARSRYPPAKMRKLR